MDKTITFVIGGCRSGKSAFALARADKIHDGLNQSVQAEKKHKYFIATSVPHDSEMEKRVIKHQAERGPEWKTIEEPVEIDEAIVQYSAVASVILVDCLTLWASNLMFQYQDEKSPDKTDLALEKLEKALTKTQCPVLLVSNEVGCGIVPENELARQFRDFAGAVNQRVARAADRVIMTVAGIEVQIKPNPNIS